MNELLHPRNTEVLSQLAGSRALLGFDFDGTLAPIVASRDGARMRRTTLALFTRVCRLYPTAVISGRSRPDVAARLGDAKVRYVVGNHGLEPVAASPHTEKAMNEAREVLTRLALATPGLDLEDKRYSLAVHYRRSRRKREARAAVLKALARLSRPMRVVPGKLVLNVVLASAPNKGDALLLLRAKANTDVALYVGDDVTDEDVFRIDQPGRLLSVRVGRSVTTAASYYLREQGSIDALLRRLITLRER